MNIADLRIKYDNLVDQLETCQAEKKAVLEHCKRFEAEKREFNEQCNKLEAALLAISILLEDQSCPHCHYVMDVIISALHNKPIPERQDK